MSWQIPENVIEKIACAARNEISMVVSGFAQGELIDTGKCESPIELIMLVALHAKFRTMSPVCFDQGGDEVILEQQVVIDGWRVDFRISFKDILKKQRYLIIECDGHDYHERTSDQAQRDRARDRLLQEKNVTIFRFTGAEIYRDPSGCADQVLKWVFMRKTLQEAAE